MFDASNNIKSCILWFSTKSLGIRKRPHRLIPSLSSAQTRKISCSLSGSADLVEKTQQSQKHLFFVFGGVLQAVHGTCRCKSPMKDCDLRSKHGFQVYNNKMQVMRARRNTIRCEQDLCGDLGKENLSHRRRRTTKQRYIATSDYKLDLTQTSDEDLEFSSREKHQINKDAFKKKTRVPLHSLNTQFSEKSDIFN